MAASLGTLQPAASTRSELDAARLADALRAGIYRLFERTDHLNRINVFPVPDGDTGTNLAMTAAAVLAALDRDGAPLHAGAVLVRAADAALDGARGNSGAILAQFLLGLADALGALERVGASDLVRAVATGAAYARDALTQPREGTILSVIARFAQELEAAMGRAGPQQTRAPTGPADAIGELIAAALPGVRESLEATRTQLDEMRAANVVDAGAQGFVDLLEGLQAYLATGELRRVAAPVHGAGDGGEAMAGGALDSSQRYCTECLVLARAGAPPLDLRQLRERLGPLGTSLVVGGSTRKARIHIHTNEPERVFECASVLGEVTAQKADDMIRQQAASHHARGQRVAIVCDSAADIPDALLEQLDVHVVPMRVHFGAHSWLDKVTLTSEDFYRELATNPEHPKTSQPPPGDFRRIYEFLASHYEAVLSISVTARVSGTYDAALGAAQRVDSPQRPVRVLDSANASLGQGLVVIAAAECARAGGSLADCVAAARAAIGATWTFGLLPRLDYAVRGGRVPRIIETLSRWLRFHAVLASFPDGRIGLGGVLLARRGLVQRFARLIARRITRGAPSGARFRLLVGHGNAPEAALQLRDALVSLLPAAALESSHVTPLGTALGVHGGPGMLVVGAQRLS